MNFGDHPVRTVFNTMPPPRNGVVAHLVHHKAEEPLPEYWTIRLYEDNFNSFSGEDRVVIFNWISDMVRNMRIFEPRVYVEKFEGLPR